MARANIQLVHVPTKLPAFLLWFRQETELSWATYEPFDFSTLIHGDGGILDWQRGTHWKIGLTDAQIAHIEHRWGVEFPPDYRLFLQTLNTVDRPMIGRLYRTGENGKEQLAYTEAPSFYDWLTDDASIDERLNAWIREGLEFDIEYNNLWRASWGARPNAIDARKKQMAITLAQAPKLIPIYGHRYLLSEPCHIGNPIYSVVQSDIIIYGDSLCDYLMYEFIDLLPLEREEIELYWLQKRLSRESYYQTIPFWHELASL